MVLEFFHKNPFIRILFAFILGILSVSIHLFETNDFYFSGLAFLTCVSSLIIIKLVKSPKKQWLSGLSIFGAFYFLGVAVSQINSPQTSIQQTPNDITAIGYMNNTPIKGEKSYKSLFTIQQIKYDSIWHSIDEEQIQVYFEPDNSIAQLNYGDIILFRGKLQPIKSSGNPHTFDYKKYMNRKGIFYQSFIQKGNYYFTNKKAGHIFLQFAHSIRAKCYHLYKSYGIPERELEVISALTLGYKELLNDDIKTMYASSGAMHILAVSGLHTGIIFFLIKFLFQFLKRKKYGNLLLFLIQLLSLSFFCLISGLSPSVIRATLMLLLISLGETLVRKSSIYNNIAAAAFILLFYKPLYLFDLSFLLSFTAVAGIVLINPVLYSIFKPKYKVFNYLWGIITVSISAQIATLPISLYSFNQFSTYFLLTNILVIPLTFCILIVSVAFFVFSFAPKIAFVLAWLLANSVWLLNEIVIFIESIELSVIHDVFISPLQLVFLSLAIASFILLLHTKKRISFYPVLIFGIFLLGVEYYGKLKAFNAQQISVLNIYKESFIHLKDNKTNFLISNSNSDKDMRSTVDKLREYFIVTSGGEPDYMKLQEQSGRNKHDIFLGRSFLTIGGHLFFLLKDDEYISCTCSQKIAVDFVILSNKLQTRLDDLLRIIDTKHIVSDSSVPFYIDKLWKEECQKKGLAYYSVRENGAWVKEVKSDE